MASSRPKATLGHIGINLSSEESSFPLWKDLLNHLGFTIIPDGNHFDATDGHSYLCFTITKAPHQQSGFHRKRTGLNHIAFNVPSAQAVDTFVTEFMAPRGLAPLYNGAKAYPQYANGYYAVYFEDADRIKIEIAFDPTLKI